MGKEACFRTSKHRQHNVLRFAEFDTIANAERARERLDGHMLEQCHYSSVTKPRGGLVCDFAKDGMPKRRTGFQKNKQPHPQPPPQQASGGVSLTPPMRMMPEVVLPSMTGYGQDEHKEPV